MHFSPPASRRNRSWRLSPSWQPRRSPTTLEPSPIHRWKIPSGSTPGRAKLGELLRYWRQERGKSQLDLSMDTGISQRHLSFVESGRSAPSRDFLSIVSD